MSIRSLSKEVYCTVHVEGTHCWPNCPLEEVSYLRDRHRHVFVIRAFKNVTHNDRDCEFIVLKHRIRDHLYEHYYDNVSRLCEFNHMSCEDIAEELISVFDLSACEVSEDDENGCRITVTRIKEDE